MRAPVARYTGRVVLIDLHAHTAPLSYDALQNPDELFAEAKGLGLDGICLTEHDAFWDHAELRRLSARYGVLALPGCEVNTDSGHFLAFGISAYEFGMHRVEFLAAKVKAAGGALVATHPYRRRNLANATGAQLDSAVERAVAGGEYRFCDAIEAANGRGGVAENRFSAALANRLGIASIGGGDSHKAGDLGICCTRFDRRVRDLDDLVSQLRDGSVEPVSLQ